MSGFDFEEVYFNGMPNPLADMHASIQAPQNFNAPQMLTNNPYQPPSVDMNTYNQAVQAANDSQMQANNLYQQNLALNQVIMNLQAQIGNLKSQKEQMQTCFVTDEYGLNSAIKSSHKRIAICYNFILKKECMFIQNGSQFDVFLLIHYQPCSNSSTNEQNAPVCKAYVPIEALQQQKLLPYFKDLILMSACPKTLANQYLYHAIQTTMMSKPPLIIHDFPGFYWDEKTGLSFITVQSYPIEENDLMKLLPKNLLNKQFPLPDVTKDEAFKALRLIDSDGKPIFLCQLLLLHAYRLAGLMASIFAEFGLVFNQMLILQKENCRSLPAVAARFLKTYHRDVPGCLSFNSSKHEIDSAFAYAKDETILIAETSIADNEKKRIEKLDIIYQNFIRSVSEPNKNPYNVALCSNAAAYHLPDDSYWTLTLDDLLCDEKTAEFLSAGNTTIDSYIIHHLLANYQDDKALLQQIVSMAKQSIPSYMTDNDAVTYTILSTTVGFMLTTIGGTADCFEMMLHSLGECFRKNKKSQTSSPNAVLNEFTSLLNKLIAKGIHIVELDSSMNFEPDTNTIIKKNNTFSMEIQTISNLFLPEMTTTQSETQIIKALKEQELLKANKKNQRTITVYDSSGTPNILNLYSFYYIKDDIRLLTDNNTEIVENLRNQDFLFSEEPTENFRHLLRLSDGRVSGKNQSPGQKENNHSFTTGKSGRGKTVFMSNQLYESFSLGHRCVVIDMSDSFSESELSKHLSEEIVTQHVSYYHMEQDGIPVNLFDTRNCTTRTELRNLLKFVIASPITDLTLKQKRILSNTLSKLIPDDFSAYHFDYMPILNDLEEYKDTAAQNLFEKLIDLFDSLESDCLPQTGWGELFQDSKEIIVISMKNFFGKSSSSQIADMLLASLMYYQMEHQNKYLDIYIDEIQSMNTSNGSPIDSIMRESRKYQAALFAATQNFISKGSGCLTPLLQADTLIFFEPTDSSREDAARTLRVSPEKLQFMKPGRCYIKSSMYNKQTGHNEPIVIYGNVYLSFDNFK